MASKKQLTLLIIPRSIKHSISDSYDIADELEVYNDLEEFLENPLSENYILSPATLPLADGGGMLTKFVKFVPPKSKSSSFIGSINSKRALQETIEEICIKP